MAALGSASVGLAVFVASRLSGAFKLALMYHALVYGFFFGIYMVMPGGFAKNFNVPEPKRMNVADVLYYTIVVHSTAGFGDIYPTTAYARLMVSLHLGLVFLQTAGLVGGG